MSSCGATPGKCRICDEIPLPEMVCQGCDTGHFEGEAYEAWLRSLNSAEPPEAQMPDSCPACAPVEFGACAC